MSFISQYLAAARRVTCYTVLVQAVLLLGLTGCLSAPPRSAPVPDLQAAVAGMPMPAAGVHPRVLFTRDELPAIRERAQTVPGGQAALNLVAWQADAPGKAVLDNARAGNPETAQNLVVNAFHQAFLYILTEEPARLDNARILLDAWAVQHGEQKTFGDWWRNGYHFALAYDWLYGHLAPATRDAMRETMAHGMSAETLHEWEHRGYIKGPVHTGRPCDWGAIASGSMMMQWLAIAGEDPRASRDFLAAIVDLMQYIADLGITADGYMNAGNGYAGGDFINYGFAVRALEVHGVPLVDHPHLLAFAEWLAYESIPGQYVFDTCSYSNGFHQGLSPLILTLARRHGGTAAWLVDQARGPARTDEIGVPGVLWGKFSADPVPPPDLPLARWFSTMGVSFSRSGWEAGSFFRLHMEPLVPGKTHPDKGTFTFYSHGQNFAADSENGFPQSVDHNIILIDGKGQHSSGGASVLDAIPRGFLASELADLNHLDVKPAYERRLEHTRTRPGPVVFGELEYGRGLPFRWEVYRPMEHADRYGLYIRGSVHPYVVILDDIRQDDEERRYEWLMHSRTPGEVVAPGQVRFSSRYSGEYVQSGSHPRARVAYNAEVPEAGVYTVHVLGRKWPQLKNWFSHHIGLFVNNKGTHIRVHDYLDDWQWYNAGTHELRAGSNEVAVSSNARGFRVAQVVASPGEDATPPLRMLGQQLLGETSDGLLRFQRQAELDPDVWTVHDDPGAHLDLYFMQPGAEDLELDFWRKPRAVPLALRAGQRAVRAGFAAVLIPYYDTDPKPVWTRHGAAGAVLAWGPYNDYLYADPAHASQADAAAPLQTDAKFALVRTRDDIVIGYTLIGGTSLSFHGQVLVQADRGPVHVLHDGGAATVQAPHGAGGRLARLDADVIVCNRREQPSGRGVLADFHAPALPDRWHIRLSTDGRLVTVEGDGPLPLKVHAPNAVECLVNGISVWFSRDGHGHIFPKIELLELAHGREPLDSTPADADPPEDGNEPVILKEIRLPRDGWKFRTDPDDVGRESRWFSIDFDEAEWGDIGIEDVWSSFGYGRYIGPAWYRRTITLPVKPARAGKVELVFGAVDEMAWVWLNGEVAGAHYEYGPAGWTETFAFDVTELLRWDEPNQITVRAENTAAAGGIYKPVTIRVLSAPAGQPE